MSKSNYDRKIRTLFTVILTLLCNFSFPQQEVALELNKGQVLSFITSRPLPDSDEKRDQYFAKVMPAASQKGFKQEGSLRIKAVKLHGADTESHVGNGNLMSIFSWPQQDAILNFEKDFEEWDQMKRMRKEIWDELRIIRVTINKDQPMVFQSDKTYRVVFVWLNEENPENLVIYQDAMKETRESLGARYIAQWDKVDYYHSFVESSGVPDLAWIIEWPSSEAHNAYIASEAFSQNVRYFMTGISKFEAYETEFVFD